MSLDNQHALPRVIIFRNELLPASETFIKEQILATKSWYPILTGYSKLADGLSLDGLNIQLIPGLDSSWFHRKWLRLHQWLGLPHRLTVKTLQRLNANLIHVHFGTDATDVWPSVKAAGLPMLVTLHGYDINIHREWWEAGNGGFLRKSYPHRLLNMAQAPNVHFIAVSNAIKKRAIEYGIPKNKITVCYIGVDTNKFKPDAVPIDQRPNRILFVGRMVEKKAPLLMIRAFAEVRKFIPDAELTMIGSGSLLLPSKELANTLGVEPLFLAQCSPPQIIKQMHSSKLLCLPSQLANNGDDEGFGIVLIEAQSCGLPVVTSARGGSIEGIIDGTTGLRVPPKNLYCLSQALVSILVNPSKAQAMSNAARSFVVKTFGISSMTQKLQCIYSAISNEAPK